MEAGAAERRDLQGFLKKKMGEFRPFRFMNDSRE
jgi:hypothetical protein